MVERAGAVSGGGGAAGVVGGKWDGLMDAARLLRIAAEDAAGPSPASDAVREALLGEAHARGLITRGLPPA